MNTRKKIICARITNRPNDRLKEAAISEEKTSATCNHETHRRETNNMSDPKLYRTLFVYKELELTLNNNLCTSDSRRRYSIIRSACIHATSTGHDTLQADTALATLARAWPHHCAIPAPCYIGAGVTGGVAQQVQVHTLSYDDSTISRE